MVFEKNHFHGEITGNIAIDFFVNRKKYPLKPWEFENRTESNRPT